MSDDGPSGTCPETLPDAFVAAIPEEAPTESLSRRPYRTLGVLGKGGMGEVVRCFDPALGRVVARKVQHTPSEKAARLMQFEARLIAFLDHPGVVPVYDIERASADRAAYTMKVLRGQTLWDRMRQVAQERRYPPLSEALTIITRLSEAMANAHDKGVLHLDLKPANVMLEPLGGVVIIDWGVATIYDPGPYLRFLHGVGEQVDPADVQSPVTGRIGTPPYMSPEQLLDPRDSLGPPADIFAAGVLLYRLLTLRAAYTSPPGARAKELARLRYTAPPRPIPELRVDVSPTLAAICHKMLAPDPADRYATFHEVLADLRGLSDVGAAARERELQPGVVLCREGERSGRAFQVLSGEVSISIDKGGQRVEVARRGVGEIIGEMSVLSDLPHSATVTATQPTRVRVLSPELLQAELDKASPLVARMLRGLSDRLIDQTRREKERGGG